MECTHKEPHYLPRYSRNRWLDPDFIATVKRWSPQWGISGYRVEIRGVRLSETITQDNYGDKSPVQAIRRLVSQVTGYPMYRVSVHRLTDDYFEVKGH